MVLIVENHQSLLSFQDDFHIAFPFLRIDFFLLSTLANGVYQKDPLQNRSSIFADYRDSNHSGLISFGGEITVKGLSDLFRNEFGIGIVVYRCSGRLWLAANATNQWSLDQQNREGESLSA
jgi:hypothetical protein